MKSRIGKTPYTLLNLASATHVPSSMKAKGLLSSLTSEKLGYASGMPTFEQEFVSSYLDEMSKIAEATGVHNPFGHLSEEEAYDLFKEAGVLDALKGYGRNISAWGRRGMDILQGGDYARQMRELGSAAPMATSAAAGKVVGNQSGPMADLARRRAAAAADAASLHPGSWGLASQAPAIHPSAAQWGLPFSGPRSASRASVMGPGGSNPLFGAPGRTLATPRLLSRRAPCPSSLRIFLRERRGPPSLQRPAPTSLRPPPVSPPGGSPPRIDLRW